ncbi:MAG: type II toxin-antitoxin system RelE/ParE family toxin [Shinella sp.]|nr:type II toxin-antitoxin system RelE/ParE family toxin [Shinella sp.]
MIEVRQTDVFSNWLKSLKDRSAQLRIQKRIDRLSYGLFGDTKFFSGIGELRIDHGPGYRVYFIKRDEEVVILLSGGDKSTQQNDIKKAIEMAKEV